MSEENEFAEFTVLDSICLLLYSAQQLAFAVGGHKFG